VRLYQAAEKLKKCDNYASILIGIKNARRNLKPKRTVQLRQP
jgi:hypothetical protein